MPLWARYSNWFSALTFAAWLFPFLPLFRLGYGYYSDWYVNLWMIGYNANYFSSHLSFPDVFHSSEVVGMPTPIFYGPLFYKLAGVIAALTGAPLALRFLIFSVSALQFLASYRLIKRLTLNRQVSVMVALFLSWGIYALTCLYNRSAMAEFFGMHFLTLTLVQIFFVGLKENLNYRCLDLWSVGLFYALTLGTHTLTGVVGGIFLVISFFTFLPYFQNRARLVFFFSIQTVLIALTLLPWLYANIKFGSLLNIVTRSVDILISTADLDLWWTRLSPWPVDGRLWTIPVHEVTTPYLTAQVNAALLLFCGYLVYRVSKARSFRQCPGPILVSATLVALTFFISVSPWFWEVAPSSVRIIQFAYRMVTYINLSLLLLCISLLFALRTPLRPLLLTLGLMPALLLVAILGPIGKLYQSQVVTAPIENDVRMANLPPEYAGAVDFGVWYFYERPDFKGQGINLYETRLTPWYGVNFGTILDANTDFPTEIHLQTNVVAFPWNLILIDAQMPSYFMSSYFLGVKVPSGAHRISYLFQPPSLFSVLRMISSLLFFVWLGTSLLVLVKQTIQHLLEPHE